MQDNNTNILLEIFSEEMPASLQQWACERLELLISKKLQQIGFKNFAICTLSAPRNLCAHITNIAQSIPDSNKEVRGLKVATDKQIFEKFLQHHKIKENDCYIKTIKNSDYYFFKQYIPGIKLQDIMQNVILEIIKEFNWTKSMRWSDNNLSWIRPIHSGVLLIGEKPCHFTIDCKTMNIVNNADEAACLKDCNKINFSDITFGARTCLPNGHPNGSEIKVTSFDQYCKDLEKNGVIIGHQKRKDIILEQIHNTSLNLTKKLSMEAVVSINEKLLEEVTNLVESPNAILLEINPELLSVPIEIITSVAQKHQKYFLIKNNDSKILPFFIAIANGTVDVNLAKTGYEKVLAARLKDASFFTNGTLRPI